MLDYVPWYVAHSTFIVTYLKDYMQDKNVAKTTLIGGVIAAVLASACCLGPLILVSIGIGGAWISNLTLLEPYRPIFIFAALMCMTIAYKKIYRNPNPEDCAPGTLCALPQTNKAYRAIFWVVSGLMLLVFTYPYFVIFLA